MRAWLALALLASCSSSARRSGPAPSAAEVLGVLEAFCEAEGFEAAAASDLFELPAAALARAQAHDQVVRLYQLEQLDLEAIDSPAASLAIARGRKDGEQLGATPAPALAGAFLELSAAAHAARIIITHTMLIPPSGGDLHAQLVDYLTTEAAHAQALAGVR